MQLQELIDGFLDHCTIFTAVIALITVVFGLLGVLINVVSFFGLSVENISLLRIHSLNTYPLVHDGFLPFVLGLASILVLMPKFERRYGTLCTIALFFGFLEVIPAGFYLLICYLFNSSTVYAGCGGWLFSFLTMYLLNLFDNLHPKLMTLSQNVRIGIAFAAPLLMLPLDFSTSFFLHIAAVATSVVFSLSFLDFLIPKVHWLVTIETKLSRFIDNVPNYVSVSEAVHYQRAGGLPVHMQDVNVPSGDVV
ncbi:rhomboid family protease [Schizosaccharomyces japonicus yFS275]|uniref:Rhomboid family protease n=1 Tax=Schizosaccharomyces japonicus (strain yFS275 / FY16936) TaxID=402676 RepID=B6K093_SCHJY|nr:rhomboid family protease [Schizosaccharomyces japonicus yFS275]EEB06243.1 rhomboid family protease [Schizosaccharomyces japonicus yFS275]